MARAQRVRWRRGHVMPEQQAVVGAFAQAGTAFQRAVKQPGFKARAEAAAMAQRRVAKRGGEEIVQPRADRCLRRFGGLDERFQP